MGMKIIKNRQEIRLSNGNLVFREEYTEGTTAWTSKDKILYDDVTAKAIEAEYQKTFNK